MIDPAAFTLTTTEERIRALTADDAAAVARITTESFGPMTLEQAHVYIAHTRARLALAHRLMQPPYGDYAVEHADTAGHADTADRAERERGRVVGLVGLVPAFGPFALLEGWGGPPHRFNLPAFGLFWAVAADARGRGVARRAAAALCAFAFTTLGVGRVVATTEHDNAASLAVMRALGMTIARHSGPPAWFQQVGWLDAPGAVLL
jgi:RimJ/RimL family protein N-acetyltransferase